MKHVAATSLKTNRRDGEIGASAHHRPWRTPKISVILKIQPSHPVETSKQISDKIFGFYAKITLIEVVGTFWSQDGSVLRKIPKKVSEKTAPFWAQNLDVWIHLSLTGHDFFY